MGKPKNGHFYVGSTLNFYNRITCYFTLKGAYGIIFSALTKYDFESLTLVLFFIPGVTREEVLQLEQSVLDMWKPEYNIQPFANSSAGWLMSKESKAKLAAYRKGLNIVKKLKLKFQSLLVKLWLMPLTIVVNLSFYSVGVLYDRWQDS